MNFYKLISILLLLGLSAWAEASVIEIKVIRSGVKKERIVKDSVSNEGAYKQLYAIGNLILESGKRRTSMVEMSNYRPSKSSCAYILRRLSLKLGNDTLKEVIFKFKDEYILEEEPLLEGTMITEHFNVGSSDSCYYESLDSMAIFTIRMINLLGLKEKASVFIPEVLNSTNTISDSLLGKIEAKYVYSFSGVSLLPNIQEYSLLTYGMTTGPMRDYRKTKKETLNLDSTINLKLYNKLKVRMNYISNYPKLFYTSFREIQFDNDYIYPMHVINEKDTDGLKDFMKNFSDEKKAMRSELARKYSNPLEAISEIRRKRNYRSTFYVGQSDCLEKLSMNLHQCSDSISFMGFPKLNTLSLYNCNDISEYTAQSLISSSSFNHLENLTLTRLDTNILERVLTGCSLKSLTLDIFTYQKLCNYSRKKYYLRQKWVNLFEAVDTLLVDYCHQHEHKEKLALELLYPEQFDNYKFNPLVYHVKYYEQLDNEFELIAILGLSHKSYLGLLRGMQLKTYDGIFSQADNEVKLYKYVNNRGLKYPVINRKWKSKKYRRQFLRTTSRLTYSLNINPKFKLQDYDCKYVL